MHRNRHTRLLASAAALSLLSAGVLAGQAAAATTASVEAESLALPSSQGQVRVDGSASGGKMLIIWSNGAAAGTLTGAGDTIAVRAKGEQCNGAPQITVSVDGRQVVNTAVASVAWADYTAPVALPAGSHKLTVAFTNDYLGVGCDRNLFVDRVVLASAGPTPTPAPTPKPTPTPTPTPTPKPTPPLGVPGAWTQTFTDEFNGTAIDQAKWNSAYCKTMNNTAIDPANATVSNGIATLKLSGGKGAMLTTSSVDGCGGPSANYQLPVGGYTEARASFPVTSTGACANWPAWWSSGPAWPAAGEHDIAEVLSGQLTVNYHSVSGAHNQGAPAGAWCGGWHTYGLLRAAGSATVYWDGKAVYSYATDDNGQGESLILNIGAHSNNTDLAKPLQVDWVHAYKPASDNLLPWNVPG